MDCGGNASGLAIVKHVNPTRAFKKAWKKSEQMAQMGCLQLKCSEGTKCGFAQTGFSVTYKEPDLDGDNKTEVTVQREGKCECADI